MKLVTLFLFMIITYPVYALVDMKNANYSHSWIDLKLEGTGFDLQLKRSYNSRSLHNGLFGFGWCSDYETKLKVTPEGNIKIIVCGGGNEIEYVSSANGKTVKKTIQKIMGKLKNTKKYTPQNLLTISKRIQVDVWEREKYARQFSIKSDVKAGVSYVAFGRKKENIVLKNNEFKRTLSDGSFQKFNLRGQLTHIYDRNNNYLKITYADGSIKKVADSSGKSITLTHDKKIQKVVGIKGPKGMNLVYKYKNEDLIYVKNAWKNVYTYKYDDLHNLERVNYPDKSFKKISYNKDKDWVIGFRDRSGCVESYNYVLSKSNPMNNYYSEVKKTCDGKITHKSKYEFIHKMNTDGSRYLAKTKSTINGEVKEVIYHPIYGKAMNIKDKNGVVKYDFYANGELKVKTEPFRTLSYFYKNSCNKVSRVLTKYYRYDRRTASKSKKIKQSKKLIKTVKTDFNYKFPRCNLDLAVNSSGQKIKLNYDKRGRIASMMDQAKKIIYIKYDNSVGKPQKITRPGIGSIVVSYNPAGEIKKVNSKEGPIVASQVASIFSNLIEVISPATSELGI